MGGCLGEVGEVKGDEKILSVSSYSNILINVYSNTDIGSQIALGGNNNFSTIETQKSWLGMYSYNIVEGYYFDDKPGQYLGVYKK